MIYTAVIYIYIPFKVYVCMFYLMFMKGVLSKAPILINNSDTEIQKYYYNLIHIFYYPSDTSDSDMMFKKHFFLLKIMLKYLCCLNYILFIYLSLFFFCENCDTVFLLLLLLLFNKQKVQTNIYSKKIIFCKITKEVCEFSVTFDIIFAKKCFEWWPL